MVYIREAHPDQLEETDLPPAEAQQQYAELLRTTHGLQMPVLLDNLQGDAATAYGAWPERAYVIGVSGAVAYASSFPGGPNRMIPHELAWALSQEVGK